MVSTNRQCEYLGPTRCPDKGWEEYCGYCAAHWVDLTDKQRKVLLEQKVQLQPTAPPVVHEHHEHKTIVQPPRNRLHDFLVFFMAFFMAVIFALWVAKGLGFLGPR